MTTPPPAAGTPGGTPLLQVPTAGRGIARSSSNVNAICIVEFMKSGTYLSGLTAEQALMVKNATLNVLIEQPRTADM